MPTDHIVVPDPHNGITNRTLTVARLPARGPNRISPGVLIGLHPVGPSSETKRTIIRVLSADTEPLREMLSDAATGRREMIAMGFPHGSPEEWARQWVATRGPHLTANGNVLCRRIEWEYPDDLEGPDDGASKP